MNKSDQWRAVVFDLDGTVLDTLPSLAAAANDVLLRAGLEQVRADGLRAALSEGLRPMFRQALALQARAPDAAQADRLEAEFMAHYVRRRIEEAVPFEGVAACLSALRERGFALAICTNRDRASTELLLAATGLSLHFDAVACAGETSRPKPAPDLLLLALQRVGARAQTSLFVGDSAIDCRCAAASGVPFAAHLPGYAGGPADLLPNALSFRSYRQLADWLCAPLQSDQEQLHA
jgi:phosphoglycolate phosphatase